jgi:hypothetical protein
MRDFLSELERALEDVELRLTHSGRGRLAARTRALDELERRVLLHLPALGAKEGASAVTERALGLNDELELRNQRMFSRLGARLAAGRYTHEGTRRALCRTIDHSEEPDWRDALLAGLIDVGPLEDERLARDRDMVFYQPTPARVILAMLERAQVRPPDVLCDLGSGLGHVLITAALVSGVRAVGIEREPAYVAYASRAVQRLSLENVELVCADAREASFGASNVFFMYTPFRGALLRQVLARLRQTASERELRICTFGPCTAEVGGEPWLRLQSCANELAVFTSFQ